MSKCFYSDVTNHHCSDQCNYKLSVMRSLWLTGHTKKSSAAEVLNDSKSQPCIYWYIDDISRLLILSNNSFTKLTSSTGWKPQMSCFVSFIWNVKRPFALKSVLSQFWAAIKGKAKGNFSRHWQADTELTQQTRGPSFKALRRESAADPWSVSKAAAATSYWYIIEGWDESVGQPSYCRFICSN